MCRFAGRDCGVTRSTNWEERFHVFRGFGDNVDGWRHGPGLARLLGLFVCMFGVPRQRLWRLLVLWRLLRLLGLLRLSRMLGRRLGLELQRRLGRELLQLLRLQRLQQLL
jgi:hypothetical protein